MQDIKNHGYILIADMADCFWKYARQTSFWEELVGRGLLSMAQNVIHSVPSITLQNQNVVIIMV